MPAIIANARAPSHAALSDEPHLPGARLRSAVDKGRRQCALFA